VHQAGGDQTPKTASLLNPEPRTLVTFVKNQGQFGASLVCRYMPWHWNSLRIYQKRLQASDFFQSGSKDFFVGVASSHDDRGRMPLPPQKNCI